MTQKASPETHNFKICAPNAGHPWCAWDQSRRWLPRGSSRSLPIYRTQSGSQRLDPSGARQGLAFLGEGLRSGARGLLGRLAGLFEAGVPAADGSRPNALNH